MTEFHGTVSLRYISALKWFMNKLLSHYVYGKTFDPKVVLGHYDLI